MKVFSFKNEKGGVSILRSTNDDPRLQEGVEYTEIQEDNIPTDRYFRNAWYQNGDMVEIDMPKAREIHMGEIRLARNKRLAESDPLIFRETEQGNDTTDLKRQRQELRDIPQNFDLAGATTPEELKILWPDLLGSD